VGAAALAAAGCTRELDMDKLVATVKAGLVSQTGLPVETVTCPATREQKAGDTFECTAITGKGAQVTVTVSQKDDEGNVAWKATGSTGVLDMRKTEATVRDGLRARSKIEVQVDCGPARYREHESGQAFECRATDRLGETLPVTVQMTDSPGQVNWRLRLEEQGKVEASEAHASP